MFSGGKNHALYLWIHLKPNADIRACARAAANLQKYVDVVCPPDMRDEDDEILAGVGFGPNFYQQVQENKALIFVFCNLVTVIKGTCILNDC